MRGMFRRTVPRLFVERQARWQNHPYILPPQPGKDMHFWFPPYMVNMGFKPSLLFFLCYWLWDNFLQPHAAEQHHHHSKWDYGMFGKRISCPAHGTQFGWNQSLGVLSFNWGQFERWEGTGQGKAYPGCGRFSYTNIEACRSAPRSGGPDAPGGGHH
eukprot:TRINITY_DN16284_c0_g1_i1.p3 TRINITY_DN16284_c0_g1~~TRINITY_DN16284_c0_g1_i1.p3  ORF type:complete len:157 (+),score=40.38 TRINITY_DN16284_c0_g1_i1:105-575(+)